MKKLSGFLSLLCILNVLMILGLAGYLLGTGRLDKAKAQVITDILRTDATPAGFRLKVHDLMVAEAATQTAPATDSRPQGAELTDIPSTAQERNEYVRKAVESERMKLEVWAQELRNERELLTRVQAEVADKIEKFEARKRVFDEQVATAGKKKDDGNFKAMMFLYDELKPKQIKDLFVTLPVDEASRYLAAMDAERAAKIISEFKSPEEKAILNALLERLRGVAPATGTGAASAPQAAYSAANTAGKVVP